MNEPIRELRQNQKDIYVTLDNHTALMQEMSETLDSHTKMLTALQTDITSRFNAVDTRFNKLESMLQELLSRVPKS